MKKERTVTINHLTCKGMINAMNIANKSNLKKIDISIDKIHCENLSRFPVSISNDADIDNPIGKIKYTMLVYRKDGIRKVHACHTYFVKDLYDHPMKITLDLTVSSSLNFSDANDEVLFEIAYAYAKAIFEETHFPRCGEIDFHLPETYWELSGIKESPKEYFDGYSKDAMIKS